MSNITVANIPPRLPMPKGLEDINSGTWRVLCESIFPTAQSPEAIVLAVDYCRARNLDIMKKPVHIVPMWSTSLRKNVETVWPSITEIQITASRTGKYAGMDAPEFGPMITREFSGTKPNDVGPTKTTVTYPEWCSVTVYRIVDGQKCAFTEPVYWEETYATQGKTELPNAMWAKRPRGQIIKVAKAFSLRAGFPEEGAHTAEEMEGKVLEEVAADGMTIEHAPASGPTSGELSAKQVFGSAKAMKDRWNKVRDAILECKTEEALDGIFIEYKADFASFKSIDAQLYDNLVMIGMQRRHILANSEDDGFTDSERAAIAAEQESREAQNGYR